MVESCNGQNLQQNRPKLNHLVTKINLSRKETDLYKELSPTISLQTSHAQSPLVKGIWKSGNRSTIRKKQKGVVARGRSSQISEEIMESHPTEEDQPQTHRLNKFTEESKKSLLQASHHNVMQVQIDEPEPLALDDYSILINSFQQQQSKNKANNLTTLQHQHPLHQLQPAIPQINMSIESKEFRQAANNAAVQRKESLKSIQQQSQQEKASLKAVTTRQSRQRRDWADNWTHKSTKRGHFDLDSANESRYSIVGASQQPTGHKKQSKVQTIQRLNDQYASQQNLLPSLFRTSQAATFQQMHHVNKSYDQYADETSELQQKQKEGASICMSQQQKSQQRARRIGLQNQTFTTRQTAEESRYSTGKEIGVASQNRQHQKSNAMVNQTTTHQNGLSLESFSVHNSQIKVESQNLFDHANMEVFNSTNSIKEIDMRKEEEKSRGSSNKQGYKDAVATRQTMQTQNQILKKQSLAQDLANTSQNRISIANKYGLRQQNLHDSSARGTKFQSLDQNSSQIMQQSQFENSQTLGVKFEEEESLDTNRSHFKHRQNLLEKTRESFENLHNESSRNNLPTLEETQKSFEKHFQNALRQRKTGFIAPRVGLDQIGKKLVSVATKRSYLIQSVTNKQNSSFNHDKLFKKQSLGQTMRQKRSSNAQNSLKNASSHRMTNLSVQNSQHLASNCTIVEVQDNMTEQDSQRQITNKRSSHTVSVKNSTINQTTFNKSSNNKFDSQDIDNTQFESVRDLDGKPPSVALDQVKAKVGSFRPPPKPLTLAQHKENLPKDEFSWKKGGPAKLLQELHEVDKYERKRANNLLPAPKEGEDDKMPALSRGNKNRDCTNNLERFATEFKKHQKEMDAKDHPVQIEQVPKPFDQKQEIVDKITAMKHQYEKGNYKLRKEISLLKDSGPQIQINPESLMNVLRDIDAAENQYGLFNLTEQQFVQNKVAEQWFKKRKNEGLKTLTKMSHIEKARQIFQAWDTKKIGYLTSQLLTEQLIGLGLIQNGDLVQILLQTFHRHPVTAENIKRDVDIITLKNFLTVFNFDNFGQKAGKMIHDEFQEELKAEYSKHKMVEAQFRGFRKIRRHPPIQKKSSRLKVGLTRDAIKRIEKMSSSLESNFDSPWSSQRKSHLSDVSERSFTSKVQKMRSFSPLKLSLNQTFTSDFSDSIHTSITNGTNEPQQSTQMRKLESQSNNQRNNANKSQKKRQTVRRKAFVSLQKVDSKGVLQQAKQSRKPSLPEKVEILNKWFSKAAKGGVYLYAELSLEKIAEFLVEKQLVSDKDSGIKHIVKALNIKDVTMKLNYILFQRLFIRALFKESLTEVLKEIEEQERQAQLKIAERMKKQFPLQTGTPMQQIAENPKFISQQQSFVQEMFSQNYSKFPLNLSDFVQSAERTPKVTKNDNKPDHIKITQQFIQNLQEKSRQKKGVKAADQPISSGGLSMAELEEEKKKNLAIDIKAFERKTMLKGIAHLKELDGLVDFFELAKQQNINTDRVLNLQGRDILASHRNQKLQFDRHYFQQQTYEDFVRDPLGNKLQIERAKAHPKIKENSAKMQKCDLTVKRIIEQERSKKLAIKPNESQLTGIETKDDLFSSLNQPQNSTQYTKEEY